MVCDDCSKNRSIDTLEYSIKFYFNRGYSYRQIAKEQGASVGTVYNVIHGKIKNRPKLTCLNYILIPIAHK